MVIEVTGDPIPNFIRTTVLDPLQINHSSYDQSLPAAFQSNASVGARHQGTEVPRIGMSFGDDGSRFVDYTS
jgi:CubicO group peptidase (beta-lactamase class C family)